jgi:DNA recombination protein RmuC
MNILSVLGLIFLFAGVGLGMYLLLKKEIGSITEKVRADDTLVEWLKSSQASVDEKSRLDREALARLNQSVAKLLQDNAGLVNSALARSTRAMNERLDLAAKSISEVSREVGQMSEIGRGIKELQHFLNSPKLRGNIGEEVLKGLITEMFPKGGFFLQYGFKSGEKVDAAIKTSAGILPIDSKFPMENFKKMNEAENKKEKELFKKTFVNDVRAHIRTIGKKYILPEEGTLDFALMYIPSESVFYEVANIPELMNYGRSCRVYPVSPTTLYAHLQTILLSFEGQKIESRGKEVFRLLRGVKKDYEKVEEGMGVLGKHIGNAYSKMGEVNQSVAVMGQKLSGMEGLGEGEEVKKLGE